MNVQEAVLRRIRIVTTLKLNVDDDDDDEAKALGRYSAIY